ncbi:OCIA domain-containing protein 1-like isoform X2 [Pollicipes pollicipes]|uniref:OCIA domain-containing protein 1-like isoform X2 n=1 Tax=Pollicipes pollicipes TaxID=41117 RepID=UPI0018850E5C|nr:OCIA domain-containing protein 1-like isoform X2 [Pollicipes pollicipes]
MEKRARNHALCCGEAAGRPSPPPGMAGREQRGGPPQSPRLTQEEARVLRECNQESFYRRSVPVSCLMMAGTLYMIRSGRWRPSKTLGPAPKVAAAGVVGYFIGKISYLEVCKEKLMALPNSPVGRMLRQQRAGGLPEPGFAELSADAPTPDTGAEARADWALPPRADGLDDYYRPTVDTPGAGAPLSTDDLQPAQTQTTYEELRRANRASVESRLRRGSGPPEPPPPLERERPPPPMGGPPTNKYGDVWDK